MIFRRDWVGRQDLFSSRKAVTVHSVTSNTLRDAQKLCILHNFALAVLGFSVTFALLHSQKIPRGILGVNSNGKPHKLYKIVKKLIVILQFIC